MKKILLFVILTMCAGIGIAQPSLSSRITTLRALNRTYYLYDTGFKRQNVMKHFRVNDSLSLYDSIIAATVVSGHDLDATLTLGNRSDLDVDIMKNGVEGEFYTKHMYNGVQTIHNPSGGGSEYPVTLIGRVAGNNVLYLRDGFGYYGYLGSGTLTANRKALLPDEGDGVGLDAHIVLHTTKDPITVTNSTYTGTYSYGAATIDDGAGNTTAMQSTYLEAANLSGTVRNRLNLYPTKLEYKYTNSVGSVTHTANLFFNRSSFTGTTNDSLWYPSARNDTLAVKGDITSLGNFATADLTLTGTRAHHLDRYGVSFDSALMWKIADTSGNYLLSLNDTTSAATLAMLYATSTPTSKHVRLNVSGSLRVLMEQSAGVNRFRATATYASLVLDSAIKAVGVNHLAGTTSAPTIAAGAGAGTSPTVSVGSGSTDLSGYVNITTGTTCTALATVATITFNNAYATAPKCIMIQPANSTTAAITPNAKLVYVNQAGITTTTFDITAGGTALSDATAYKWYYFIVQ